MGRIITYRNDRKYCFCQYQLDDGERVLISIGSGSIRVYKVILWGNIPTRTVWEANAPGDIAFLLDSDEKFNKHPLDLVLDRIIGCKTLSEVPAQLLAGGEER
jgi:hypothetical protein